MTDADAPPSPSLRRLIDETSDLIDSPSFAQVLTLLLDAAFSHLIDTKIAQNVYKIPAQSTTSDASAPRVQDVTDVPDPAQAKAKVANALAVFCRQAHAIGSGANNDYLSAVENVAQLEAFAAVVYSSNFDFEAPGYEDNGSAPAAPSSTALGDVVATSSFEDAWGKAEEKAKATSVA
jgi:peroxin-3